MIFIFLDNEIVKLLELTSVRSQVNFYLSDSLQEESVTYSSLTSLTASKTSLGAIPPVRIVIFDLSDSLQDESVTGVQSRPCAHCAHSHLHRLACYVLDQILRRSKQYQDAKSERLGANRY